MAKPAKKEGREDHDQFVKWMVKKANTEDKTPEAFTVLSPASKDPETKPNIPEIKEEDIKKVEEHWNKFKKSIK